jgi:hypothetical protein
VHLALGANARIFFALNMFKTKLNFFPLVCSTSTQPATPKHRSLLWRARKDLQNALPLQNSPISLLHHHIPSPGVIVYRESRQLGIRNDENSLFQVHQSSFAVYYVPMLDCCLSAQRYPRCDSYR